jgi:endonuclease YncB( thermonuclease family)
MTYTLIKGYFYVVGYSPDGDSIKFQAKNQTRWNKITTEHREKFAENLAEDNGIITLRLQGIDALETHYSPPPLPIPKDLKQKKASLKKPDPGGHKQPEELGELATVEFMQLLGINRVEWKSWGKHTWVDKAWLEKRGKEICLDKKYKDKVPGYIVTRDVEKNGRPIAWVFPGSTRKRDGSSLTAPELFNRVEKSANYQLLLKGLVYPYFFMTLPGKLRDKLAAAAQQARADEMNLWARDKTDGGVSITSLRKITDDHEIYPYLFRRILKHWHRQNMERYWEALRHNDQTYNPAENTTQVKLKGFFDTANPYIFVISDQDFVRLDEIIEIKRNRLKMKKYPFDIVFLS